MLITALNQTFPEPRSLLIAYSGGMDSHVLLHASRHCGINHSLRAVHLNHGLSPNALQWQQHAEQVCKDLNIPLITKSLNLTIPKGESLEAAAREARYAYFAEILQTNEILCTAHHQDDQMETVFLQLLRGAGPKGLAAMSAFEPFAKGYFSRPLLNSTHDLILNYAHDHNLTWITDESNSNTQFDRNFLRHEIMPVLKKRFPKASETVSRSAAHCASAQRVLEYGLTTTLKQVTGDFAGTLSRAKLSALDSDLQTQVLRTWLVNKNIPMPSTQQLVQLKGLLALKNDVKAIVTWQNYSVRLYQDSLFAAQTHTFNPPDPIAIPWDASQELVLPQSLGTLKFIKSPTGQLSADILQKNITIAFRQIGDGLRFKKIFQELNIPSWQRWQLPLIYVNDELAAIADVWISKQYTCTPGKIGLQVMFEKNI